MFPFYYHTDFKILNSLPKTEISPKLVSLKFLTLTVERALGMIWNVNQDELTFKPVAKVYPKTKCGILSLVSSVFGLLGGFGTKFTRTKLIIQELWKLKISWNEQISKPDLKPDGLYGKMR